MASHYEMGYIVPGRLACMVRLFGDVHEKLGAVVHTYPRLGTWKRVGRSLGCCYLV